MDINILESQIDWRHRKLIDFDEKFIHKSLKYTTRPNEFLVENADFWYEIIWEFRKLLLTVSEFNSKIWWDLKKRLIFEKFRDWKRRRKNMKWKKGQTSRLEQCCWTGFTSITAILSHSNDKCIMTVIMRKVDMHMNGIENNTTTKNIVSN